MIFDVKGFGEDEYESFVSKEDNSNKFVSNDFDRSVVADVNHLVKYEVINRKFSLEKLLNGAGYDTSNGIMFCPFHPDKATGKPSAKYHKDTDLLYCFSESKMYSAYHALKLIYGKDVNQVFNQIWADMPLDEKEDVLSKFDDNESVKLDSDKMEDEWSKYIPILNNFRDRNITYTQFKNGLYKTMLMIKESEESKNG